MEEKNKRIIFSIIAIVGLFVLVAIFFGYFLAKRGVENKITTDKSEIARINKEKEEFQLFKAPIYQLINENNYEEAINKINLLLGSLLKENQLSNPNREANLKIVLAETYINYFREDDFKKGVAILKEVANNTGYASRLRAIALDRLALYSVAYNSSFAKENIFNDTYFSAMMKEGKLGLAQKRLYEESLSLQRTVIPYYELAEWYAVVLLENGNLSAEDRKNYLQSAKMYLKKGEDLFSKDSSWDWANWDLERLILAYRRYGEVATKLYLLKEFNDSQKIIDSFDKAIAVYEKKYNIQQWPVKESEIKMSVLRMRLPLLIFSYASSLAVIQNQENQDSQNEISLKNQDKIKALLEILYDKEWDQPVIFNVFSYLKDRKKTSYNDTYARLKIVSLAKTDSRFADLLISLGWKKEQLSKLPVLPFEIKK